MSQPETPLAELQAAAQNGSRPLTWRKTVSLSDADRKSVNIMRFGMLASCFTVPLSVLFLHRMLPDLFSTATARSKPPTRCRFC